MKRLTFILVGCALVASIGNAFAESNGWNPDALKYTRPKTLAVEITTPSKAQLDIVKRPPTISKEARDPRPTTTPPPPVEIGGVSVLRLMFRDTDGDLVPALYCRPPGRAGKLPLVVIVHGASTNKAQMCAELAPPFNRNGFAVIAPDLPMHGERVGNSQNFWDTHDARKSADLIHQAVTDIRQCIDAAEQMPEIDTSRGVILVGYSFGSWVTSVAGPLDPRVRAMVLMSGGARDNRVSKDDPNANDPEVLSVDPTLALQHFVGRPLLMINGKDDQTILPEVATRLFGAASEPKKQSWYDTGHALPPQANGEAAKWSAATWQKLPPLDKN